MPTQKELVEQAAKDYGIGGGNTEYFRFDKSGNYKIRLLTACYPMATYFFGKGVKPKIGYTGMEKPVKDGEEIKPSVKFVGYVLDREDGEIKIAELPFTVVKAVSMYQEDEDYAFADFPMPYDVKITYDKEASPGEMYKLMPAPKQEPLTEAETDALEAKMAEMTPEQYVEKRKSKQKEADSADASYGNEAPQDNYPTEEINPENIPF